MALTFFWNKVPMWNHLLCIVHNEYSNPLSKSYSIRYQLVLLVDWLKLVGTRSNEVERNLGFFHVEAPPFFNTEKAWAVWPKLAGHTCTFAPIERKCNIFCIRQFFWDVDRLFCYFSSYFGVSDWNSKFYDFVPQSVRARIDPSSVVIFTVFKGKMWS